jgi:hypothetical protein
MGDNMHMPDADMHMVSCTPHLTAGKSPPSLSLGLSLCLSALGALLLQVDPSRRA